MKTKREYLNLYLFEMDVLAKHFEEMAEKGWMLSSIGMFYITYQECDPQDVHFFIDIYLKGGYLNPRFISSDEKSYGEFISEYGYEFVTRTSNIQVFMSHEKDIIPIHDNDPDIKKAQRKAIIKYEIYNHLAIIPLILLNFTLFSSNTSLYSLTNNFILLAIFIFPLLLVFIAYRTYPTIKWFIVKDNYHITSEKMIKRNTMLNRCYLIFLSYIICMFFSLNSIVLTPLLLILALSSFGFFLIDPLLARFIKRFHSVVALILCMYLAMLINVNFFIFPTQEMPKNTEYGSITYTTLRSDLPELKDHNLDYQESILLREESYSEYYFESQDQNRNIDEDLYFGYELYTINTMFFQDYIIDIALHQGYRSFTFVEEQRVNDIPYQLYQNEYEQCLIWKQYILFINIEEPLTTSQITSIMKSVN